jgi:hypothetical protein
MHGCVYEAVDDDESSGDLVEVDVLVQRKEDRKTEFAKFGDAVTQHHHQDEHGGEVEALT